MCGYIQECHELSRESHDLFPMNQLLQVGLQRLSAFVYQCFREVARELFRWQLYFCAVFFDELESGYQLVRHWVQSAQYEYLCMQCVELTVSFEHVPVIIFSQYVDTIHLNSVYIVYNMANINTMMGLSSPQRKLVCSRFGRPL